MKKLSILLSLLGSVIAFPTFAQDLDQVELTRQQQTVYQQLQAESSNLNVSWNEQDAVPKWVRMTDLEINWRSADYTERAYQFLDEYGALYKIAEPRQVLQVQDQQQDTLGMTHVTLQQVYQGVPVFAGQLQFHFRADGTISSISGHYFPDQLAISSKPTITRQRARQLAKQAVRNQLDLTQDQLNQLELQSTEPTLYFYNHGIFSKRNESTYLVWTFSVHSKKTLLDQVFYINAHTGSVVHTINNIQTAEAINTLVLADCTDAIGTLTYNETSTSDIDTIGSASSDAQAWEVNGYTDLVYDYYFDTFGRDSFDDTDPDDTTDGGGTMTSYTHLELDNSGTCEQTENAFWYPDEGVMYYGEDYITLDVTGHELTHAVVQYAVGTTDDDTLTYEDETGALNESYADVFGEFVELANGGTGDWLHREDYVDGANRNFADPNMSAYDETLSYDAATNFGQPAHMDEKADVTDPVCDSLEDDDNGCVHLNSGITNNALYLLIEGGTNTYSGDVVTGGVPREAAEQIYYQALTTHLGIASDFSADYYATMQSCLDLYESDATTYPITYCEEIFDAFAAVGINTDSSYAWANISASATSGTGPLTITFDGADSVGINSTISSYTWDFGDGSTDSGGAVSYTYSNPGTYIVTLTVVDSTGYVSDTSITITIYASGAISADTTWLAEDSPYVISGSVSISSGYTLTIEPGTVVKFLNTSSYLTVLGALDAQGTATEPIIFTSYKDDDNGGDTNGDGTATTPAAGDWYHVRTYGSSATATLDYVTMQYGGYTGTTSDYGMFWADDNTASVTVGNSILQYSQYYTLQVDSDSTVTIDSSTITNTNTQPAAYVASDNAVVSNTSISATSSYGIQIYGASPTITGNNITDSERGIWINSSTSAPIITDNTFTDNTYAVMDSDFNEGTTFTGNAGSGNTYNGIIIGSVMTGTIVLGPDDNDLPYLISGSGVSSGSVLTLEPGLVLKFISASSTFVVTGQLNAEGTATEPIVFTSYKDDTYGGDTNEDGSSTTPAEGDWYYFKAADGSTVTLQYVTVLYGGYDGSIADYGMFWIDDNASSVTIDNSVFQDSEYSALQIDPGSNVTVTNSTIDATDRYGVYVTGGTTTLENNNINSDEGGGYGIYISNASPTITNNIINNTGIGIYITGSTATPTITGNTITSSAYGIYTRNITNPTVTDNLIYDNTSYGLYNNSTTTITAENNWWGDASGPYNATTNPTGTGDTVSSYVDFDPWTTTDPTADTTPPSDVTLGTTRKDVWAQTVTLNWTNPTDSDFDHIQIDRTDVLAGTTTTLSSSETGTSYMDTTPSYNTIYTYTLYTVDTTGNVSTGVTTSNQRLRNPAPTNLTLTAGDTTIAATWNASSAPASTIGGYIVYYGTSRTALTNSVDVGNITTATLTGLTNYTRYFVAVTAYSKGGHESAQSGIRATRPHP